jgi:defect in organelle trafficking protein DotB
MVSGGELKYGQEPVARWMPDDFARLLRWGAESGMSDLTIYPKSPVWIRLNGKWLQATERNVATEELFYILEAISRNDAASAQIKSGSDLDFAYEIQIARGIRKRFRVCATACKDGWGTGVSMVFRTIPEHPPSMQDLKIEKEIIDAAFPNNGLVLVTGTMGSGKSTTLAAMLRHIGQHHSKHIVTYEEPIEFDLMSLPDLSGPLIQSAVPQHIDNFLSGIRNATRRAPDVILVGESRDPETLRGMIEAAEIGVTAYSTVHTRSVSETPTRIINVFPSEQQQQIASTMLASLRLIIQQRLVPSTKGGRVAIREYLSFTPEIRRELMKTRISDLIPTIDRFVIEKGQPLLKAAAELYTGGIIENQYYQQLIKERQADKACSGETQPYIPN